MNTYPTFQEREYSRYQIYATQFVEFHHAIEAARETFSQDKVWPDQCDYLLYKIKPLQKTVNGIATLAQLTKKQSNKRFQHNYYSLLVSVHYFCDQVDTLVACIREYKEVAENLSDRKLKQRLIIRSLHSLDSSLHDLMKEIDKRL